MQRYWGAAWPMAACSGGSTMPLPFWCYNGEHRGCGRGAIP
ncbi:hypothetical protein [Paenibacillus tundrae]|nr:hypothetical protein [Paenibacillus tundrae]